MISCLGLTVVSCLILSGIEPLEKVLSRDNPLELARGRVDHGQVPQVHLSHVVCALPNVVRREHHHWILNHVGPEVDLSLLIIIANVEDFLGNRNVDAPEVASELSPREDLARGRGWECALVKVVGEGRIRLLLSNLELLVSFALQGVSGRVLHSRDSARTCI